MATGVYVWTNTANGKVYVGSAATSFDKRRRCHVSSLSHGTHPNRHLQHAWDKDGSGAFVFEILERCPPASCVEREQHWIDKLLAADPEHGYNLNPTAGSRLGARMPENAERNRERCKGVSLTEEHKAKVSAALKGRTLSAEHRANLSASRKGMKFTAEHCAKIKAFKRANPPCYWLGKRLSEEHRAKISAGKRGKVSPKKGKPMSADQVEKLKEAWKRRKARTESAQVKGQGVPDSDFS